VAASHFTVHARRGIRPRGLQSVRAIVDPLRSHCSRVDHRVSRLDHVEGASIRVKPVRSRYSALDHGGSTPARMTRAADLTKGERKARPKHRAAARRRCNLRGASGNVAPRGAR
jgi:hypothetical protein